MSQTVFLSKQVLTTVTGRLRDAQMIKVSRAYIHALLRRFTTSNTLGKEASAHG